MRTTGLSGKTALITIARHMLCNMLAMMAVNIISPFIFYLLIIASYALEDMYDDLWFFIPFVTLTLLLFAHIFSLAAYYAYKPDADNYNTTSAKPFNQFYYLWVSIFIIVFWLFLIGNGWSFFDMSLITENNVAALALFWYLLLPVTACVLVAAADKKRRQKSSSITYLLTAIWLLLCLKDTDSNMDMNTWPYFYLWAAGHGAIYAVFLPKPITTQS